MSDNVASLSELHSFNRAATAEKRVTASLRAIIEEIAVSSTLRYPWLEVRPLLAFQLSAVLSDMAAEAEVEVGPARPLQAGESPAAFKIRAQELLHLYEDGPPFTIQRLSELLLEPYKYHSRFDKLALAIEKLLLVTSTISTQGEQSPGGLPNHAGHALNVDEGGDA